MLMSVIFVAGRQTLSKVKFQNLLLLGVYWRRAGKSRNDVNKYQEELEWGGSAEIRRLSAEDWFAPWRLRGDPQTLLGLQYLSYKVKLLS